MNNTFEDMFTEAINNNYHGANQYTSVSPQMMSQKTSVDQNDKMFKLKSDEEQKLQSPPKVQPYPLNFITDQLVDVYLKLTELMNTLENSLKLSLLSSAEKDAIKLELSALKYMRLNLINFSRTVEQITL